MGPVIVSGVAMRAYPGQREAGDKHLVKPMPDGALVAVVDALGHGPDAARAAQIAIATLDAHAGADAVALVRYCHAALRKTRGVVMSLAVCAPGAGRMTWLGVGNVEAVLLRAPARSHGSLVGWPRWPRESLLLRGGVIGYQLPVLKASTLSLSSDGVLVFATDGIRGEFASGLATAVPAGATPQQAADALLARYGKDNDDALVLVVRCAQGPA